jgi:predicted amino acid-binding ACT domain protein
LPNAAKLLSNYGHRIVKTKWAKNKEISFLTGLRIIGMDDVGVVNKITTIISGDLRINISAITIESKEGLFEGTIRLFVHDKEELDELVARLKNLQGIQADPISTIVPDIHKQSSDYEVIKIGGAGAVGAGCFAPYVAPDDIAGTSATLTIDDKYSALIPIGFNFNFYGTTYTGVAISTNGLISFDATRANATCGFGILNSAGALSATAGTPQDLPSTLYDKAIIMGPYHDINPAVTTSPNRKIQYQVLGTAPYRRFVFSFYKVPLFNCNSLFENTHQIVLYETTNIIEVFMFDKQICTTWNQGRAMIGIQDETRTKAVMAPGRRASDPAWGTIGMNEAWRFIPKNGPTLLKRVELLNPVGTIISTGVTGTPASGTVPVSFPDFCVPVSSTSNYIVRSVYEDPANAANETFGLDTFPRNDCVGYFCNYCSNPGNLYPQWQHRG